MRFDATDSARSFLRAGYRLRKRAKSVLSTIIRKTGCPCLFLTLISPAPRSAFSRLPFVRWHAYARRFRPKAPAPALHQAGRAIGRRTRWQQGVQARVSDRRGVGRGLRYAGHHGRTTIQPLPTDSSGRRHERARVPSGTGRKSAGNGQRQPAARPAFRRAYPFCRRAPQGRGPAASGGDAEGAGAQAVSGALQWIRHSRGDGIRGRHGRTDGTDRSREYPGTDPCRHGLVVRRHPCGHGRGRSS